MDIHGKIYTDGEFGCLKLSEDLSRQEVRNLTETVSVQRSKEMNQFLAKIALQWFGQFAICGREEEAKNFPFLEPGRCP